MIKLQVLAKDFTDTRYTNSEDCAITRALKRAELGQWRHTGRQIRNSDGKWDDQEILCTYADSNLEELSHRVWNMYHFIEKPEDFEFTLIINKDENIRTAGTESSDNQGVHEA